MKSKFNKANLPQLEDVDYAEIEKRILAMMGMDGPPLEWESEEQKREFSRRFYQGGFVNKSPTGRLKAEKNVKSWVRLQDFCKKYGSFK